MIDSHCHIYFKSLKNNLPKIIDNAQKNYITAFLTINTDPEDFLDHYKLIKEYQSVFIRYGLHPENISNNKIITKDEIIKNTYIDKVIGIGETGLDFFHSLEFKKEQYICFEAHIEASIETNLPLIIHQRNSENEIINLLKKYQSQYDLKIVFHCFTGSNILKNFCLDNNYSISLSGIITFKNALEIRNVIKDMPISLILMETDSPFLAPVPLRGKLNEPSNIKYVARYLSEFYKIPLNILIKNTDDNFYKLFSKAIRYNEIF